MFDTFRNLLITNLSVLLPPLHADLLGGIVLGVNSFPKVFYDQLKMAGLVHVVVVSGYNISVVSRVLLVGMKSFPFRLRIGCVLALVVLYTLLTGASAPTVRAAIMAFIALTAQLLGRPNWGLYSLGVSGFMMVFVDPSLLSSISFQLTFAATLGILLFEDHFSNLFSLRIPGILRRDLTTSLAAQVFVVPIILYNFGTVSLISPVANMLSLWLVPLMTYLGFLVLGVSLISLPLAGLFSWPLYLLAALFISLTTFFARIPFASVTLGKSNLGFALGVSFLSLGFALFARRYSLRKHTREVGLAEPGSLPTTVNSISGVSKLS